MIRSLLFYRHFSKNHFAKALALYSDFPRIETPYAQYACYRLGMYRSIADTPFCHGNNWRGGFARAVSLAACGHQKESEKQAETWLEQGRSDEQKANLADCLAPFHPELAHSIVQRTTTPVLLKAALCLRVGQDAVAREMLTNHLTSSEANIKPECFLYASNADPSLTHLQKLTFLNKFLTQLQVPEVELVDVDSPPGPMNVRMAGNAATVDGPLVSILMTAFNSAERIAVAIQSILNQTYRNLELIIVDDAGSDETPAIVEKVAATDPRVKFIRLPRNVGTYVAKNIGMHYATGEFVSCHDSDDWAHPVKIERQVDPLLKNQELVFSSSHWVRMQDDGLYYARPVHPLMRINPASPLFRRKLVLEKAGAWDPVRTGADSEFLARLKLVFGRKAMWRIAEPLTLGSHRPDSLMTASATGYSAQGMSPTRLAYWEAWNRWHIDELREKRLPQMRPFHLGQRQFEAPEAITVPHEDIRFCLESHAEHP